MQAHYVYILGWFAHSLLEWLIVVNNVRPTYGVRVDKPEYPGEKYCREFLATRLKKYLRVNLYTEENLQMQKKLENFLRGGGRQAEENNFLRMG